MSGVLVLPGTSQYAGLVCAAGARCRPVTPANTGEGARPARTIAALRDHSPLPHYSEGPVDDPQTILGPSRWR